MRFVLFNKLVYCEPVKTYFIPICLGFFLLLMIMPVGLRQGEGPLLVTSAFYLGISHPPGYPLYQQIAKLVLYLPLGSISYRLNCLSLLTGLCVCGFVIFFLRSLVGKFFLLGLLIILSSPTFLDSFLKTEVYSLNLFFICMFFLCFHQWRLNIDKRWILLFSFLFGLSCGHHLTLPVVAMVVMVSLLVNRRVTNCVELLKIILFFIMGISILLYLPIRSSGMPPVNWGDPDSFSQFVTLATASDEAFPSVYDSIRLLTFDNIGSNIKELLFNEYSLFLICLSIYGCLRLLKHKKEIALLTIVIFSVLLVSTTFYHSHESNAFFLPAYLVMVFWMTYGLSNIATDIKKVLLILKLRRFFSPQRELVGSITFIIIISLLVISYQLPRITFLFKGNDTFDLIFFSRGIFSESKNNAYILTDRSNFYFLLLYQQYCELTRPTNYIIFRHLLSFPWFLLNHYSGIWPIDEQFDVRKFVENSQYWNETISAAIIKRAIYEDKAVYLLEPHFFNRFQSSYFRGLHLIPTGFHFLVSDRSFLVKEESIYYNWFSEYTIDHVMNLSNRDLFKYIHTLQQKEHNLLDNKTLAFREAYWIHKLNFQ